jgi:hypothetical protein
LTQKERNCWTATLQRINQENERVTNTKKQKVMVEECFVRKEFSCKRLPNWTTLHVRKMMVIYNWMCVVTLTFPAKKCYNLS